MNTADRLKKILKDQIEGYRSLAELLRQERVELVNLSPVSIEELAKEKDTAVLRLRLLEEERIRLLTAFAQEQGVSADINLLKLAELTGDRTFQDLRLQLLSLLQAISELNEFNRILIERSSGIVRNALNFLGTLRARPVAANGALFSKEA